MGRKILEKSLRNTKKGILSLQKVFYLGINLLEKK